MSSKEERKNYLKKELIRIETKIKKLQEKKKKIKDEYKNLWCCRVTPDNITKSFIYAVELTFKKNF